MCSQQCLWRHCLVLHPLWTVQQVEWHRIRKDKTITNEDLETSVKTIWVIKRAYGPLTPDRRVCWQHCFGMDHPVTQNAGNFSLRRHEFAPRSVHMGFMVNNLALGQVFFQVLWISPVNIIPPWLHIHLCIIWGIDSGAVTDLVSQRLGLTSRTFPGKKRLWREEKLMCRVGRVTNESWISDRRC
jgi:hypothetical protein